MSSAFASGRVELSNFRNALRQARRDRKRTLEYLLDRETLMFKLAWELELKNQWKDVQRTRGVLRSLLEEIRRERDDRDREIRELGALIEDLAGDGLLQGLEVGADA